MPVSIVIGFLHVVGRIAADAFRRIGHRQHHAGGHFDRHGFVFDERHGDGSILDEIILRVADDFRA